MQSISLAAQNEHFTGTITFLSAGVKQRALKEASIGSIRDDTFEDLTVLFAPNEYDIEYVYFILRDGALYMVDNTHTKELKKFNNIEMYYMRHPWPWWSCLRLVAGKDEDVASRFITP